MNQKDYNNYTELPLMLNAKQLQSVLGISRSATYCLLNDPRFPKIRIGARYVIPRNEFLQWVDVQLNVAAAS